MLSPKFDNLDLSNLGSPRFDISEFLKTPETPKDGNQDDDFYNLPEISVSSPTFNPVSLPSFDSDKIPRQETDSDSLMVDGKEAETESLNLDTAMNGELMRFDSVTDMPGDPLPFLDNSPYDLINNCPVPLSIVPPPETGFSSMGYLPTGFDQNPPPLGSEPGGLLEVEERTLASMDQGVSSFNGLNSLLFSSNLMDWGMPQSDMQATNPQCDSCQLLRRIIHSNGFQDTKLELHCLEGQNYHAVFQTRSCIDGYPPNLTHQMIEFPAVNAEYIKHFLMQYSHLRRNEGFVLRHDSIMVNTDMGMGVSMISDQFFPGPLGCHPQQTGQHKQIFMKLRVYKE
eukprot:Gb_29815 [translate_table: standard]